MQRLIEFSHQLRAHGFTHGVAEDIAAQRALCQMTVQCSAINILRPIYAANPTQFRAFRALFDRFWLGHDTPVLGVGRQALTTTQTALVGLSGISEAAAQNHDTEARQGVGAGKNKTIAKADFRFIKDAAAMREIETQIDRLSHWLLRRHSRHYQHAWRGQHLAMAQTIRTNLATPGYLFDVLYHARKPEPVKVLFIQDVSHSMAWDNPLLTRMVSVMSRALPNTESFAFHVELFRTTPLMQHRNMDALYAALEGRNRLFMGGTCIAKSIEQFNRQYARRYLTAQTNVVILSDGLDSDKLPKLQAALKTLRKRCLQILWLNPMLGRNGVVLDPEVYRATRGLVSAFLPGSQLDGLRQMVRNLR